MTRQSRSQAGEIRIGISGWRYPPWRGTFYPADLPQRSELKYASRQVATIEINGSFYSLQRPEHYARWRAETPDGFVFSVKAPRYITHILRLRESEQALSNFLASGVANLGEKLGPILWQLPPNFKFDRAVLDRFLASLPGDTDAAATLARRRNEKLRGRARLAFGACRPLRHAIEVRNATFVDEAFIDSLRRHRIALVVADTAGKWPYAEDLTSDFVYVRLHGDKELYVSGYTDAALEQWRDRLVAWSKGDAPADAVCIAKPLPGRRARRDVFCYFDNDVKVKAPRDARALAERVISAGGNVIAPGANAGDRTVRASARSTQNRAANREGERDQTDALSRSPRLPADHGRNDAGQRPRHGPQGLREHRTVPAQSTRRQTDGEEANAQPQQRRGAKRGIVGIHLD